MDKLDQMLELMYMDLKCIHQHMEECPMEEQELMSMEMESQMLE